MKSPRAAEGYTGSATEFTGDSLELMCSYNLRGNVIEISEALERLMGYTRHETRGMNVSELLEPSSLQTAGLLTVEQLGTLPQTARVIARAKDGHPIPLDVATRLVFERGTAIAVQGFARQTQSSMREAGRSVATRFRRSTAHLKHLHRLTTARHDSLDHVFADFLRTGCELFGLDLGLICYVDGDGAVIIASHGGSAALSTGLRLPLHQTHWSSVEDRLRTRVSSDAPARPTLHPELRLCLATPILVEAELFGTLSFSSSSSHQRCFSSEERATIEMMARSLSRSILEHRIRSERKSSDTLERDRNKVLELMAGNRPLATTLSQLVVMLETQCPGALCSVLVPRNGVLLCEAGPSLPAGYSGKVDRLRIPVSGSLSGEGTLRIRIAALAKRFGLNTESSLPISTAGGRLLGLIFVHAIEGSRPSVNAEVLRFACRLAAIAIEQRQLTDKLEFQAQHDFLTGLPNRFRLLELLAYRLHAAAADGSILAVLFIDLDGFKQINDTLGHMIGDRILMEVAERLRRGLTHTDDIAGRMGGDEFTVVLSHAATREVAFEAAHQFLHRLRAPYLIDGHELFVTASIGISSYPQDGAEAATLLQKSDQAMYGAKKSGKNDIELFLKDSAAGGVERLAIQNALPRALEKSEMELSFQPIANMHAELDGFEVLLAWNHPKLGRISPRQFIPIAEQIGLIVPIGRWVVEQACIQGAQWIAAGLRPGRMAVNVSPIQFSRDDFLDTVAEVLASSQFPPNLLDLELTESVLIRDMTDSSNRLSRLRELGVRISIDDFGTGYSSLSYLRNLPVDTLKIDRSFLRDLEAPGGSWAVIQTIVSLAHDMKLEVIAEGVETAHDLELLRAAGCDKVQGHVYGEALSAIDAELLMSSNPGRLDQIQR